MYRLFLLLMIQGLCTLLLYGQQKTNLTIDVDSAVLKSIVIDYNDGIDLHLLNDSLLSKSQFNLPLNGPYGLLSIQTDDGDYSSFLVHQAAALLTLSLDKQNNLQVVKNQNLLNPFEPANKIHSEYKRAITPTAAKLNQLYSTHGYLYVNQNDSLNSIQNKLLKLLDSCKMAVFEKYPNEYYSFFMAKNMVEAAIKHNATPNYLKELRFFMTNTYPDKFMKTRETQYLLETIDYKINALTQKNDIHTLLFTDDRGKKFSLRDITSEYVLIDIWATWCPPCMKQLPELDDLSINYPTSKLQLIGINVDRSYANFKNASSGLSKNWIHIFDHESKIRRFLDINSFPTTILLDKHRNIIWQVSGRIDKSTIIKHIN